MKVSKSWRGIAVVVAVVAVCAACTTSADSRALPVTVGGSSSAPMGSSPMASVPGVKSYPTAGSRPTATISKPARSSGVPVSPSSRKPATTEDLVVTVTDAEGETVTGELVRHDKVPALLRDSQLYLSSMNGRLTATSGGGALACEFEAKIELSHTAAARLHCDVTSDDTAVAMELVQLRGEGYVGGSFLENVASLDEGIEWVKQDPESDNPVIAALSRFSVFDSLDPQKFANLFDAATIIDCGPAAADDAGKVPSREYVLLESGGPRLANSGEVVHDRDGELGSFSHVFIDEKGNITRIRSKAEILALGADSTEIVIDSYDQPVEIKAPDPSTVGEA